jgi:hypothetical protein
MQFVLCILVGEALNQVVKQEMMHMGNIEGVLSQIETSNKY